MHPADKEDLADLASIVILGFGVLGFLSIIVIILGCTLFSTKPTFQYAADPYTKITVAFYDCVTFGRESTRGSNGPLTYQQNGVERTLDQRATQLSEQPVIKACLADLVQKAGASLRHPKPLTSNDNFSARDVHPRFELSYKENTPFITSYFLNGVKINSLTMPLEACVNPQFDGPVSFSYQEKTYQQSTVNILEQQLDGYHLLKRTCEQLNRTRDPNPNVSPCGNDVMFCDVKH